MPTAAWVALSTVLAAALGAVATWAAVRRQRSGRINTTEAVTLWEESQSIRKELREEANALRQRLAEAEAKLAKALQDLATTNMKLMSAKNVGDQLREEILELRRICGKTNEDVITVRHALDVIRSDTPTRHEQRRRRQQPDKDDQ